MTGSIIALVVTFVQSVVSKVLGRENGSYHIGHGNVASVVLEIVFVLAFIAALGFGLMSGGPNFWPQVWSYLIVRAAAFVVVITR